MSNRTIYLKTSPWAVGYENRPFSYSRTCTDQWLMKEIIAILLIIRLQPQTSYSKSSNINIVIRKGISEDRRCLGSKAWISVGTPGHPVGIRGNWAQASQNLPHQNGKTILSVYGHWCLFVWRQERAFLSLTELKLEPDFYLKLLKH